jgi:hypothetical protein
LKASPVENEERSVLIRTYLKFDKEGAVHRYRGKLFQQLIGLIKNEEKNLTEPLIDFCIMGRGVLDDEVGI